MANKTKQIESFAPSSSVTELGLFIHSCGSYGRGSQYATVDILSWLTRPSVLNGTVPFFRPYCRF